MADQESGFKGGMAGMMGSMPAVIEHLKDIDYPKKKDEIIQIARQKGVPEQIIDKLDGLADRVYNSAEDVMSGMKQ